MYYKVDLGYKYPDRSDEHMLEVKHLRDTNFDVNYHYYPKGFFHKIQRIILWLAMNIIAFPICTIRYGLKIKGRKEFKQFRKNYKGNAITIANHVLRWDYICVLKSIRPMLQYHMAWKTNFEGKDAPFIRFVGGIPIPTDNKRAMVKFSKAIDELLNDGKWLHVFPEGSMWFYYPDIRPLKPAIFRIAVKHNKPIIPITLSFRERTGLYKLFGKTPLVDLTIGKAIFPDTSISIKEAIDKMHKEAYHVMQVMVGINPSDDNYNDDQNIDNYVKTM